MSETIESSLAARVNLAFAAVIPLWRYVELGALAFEAGVLTAKEGGAIKSPLVELAEVAGNRCGWTHLIQKRFELGYLVTSSSVDPTNYFEISVSGAFLKIKSRNLASGSGELKIHKDFVRRVFNVAKNMEMTEYSRWAYDPYPTGGYPVLMRISVCREDDSPKFDDPQLGMIVLDPDTHPSKGRICFGEPDQEMVQLAAFVKLEDLANQMMAQAIPTPAEENAAESRAKVIIRRDFEEAGRSFVPYSGYCTWCDSDITPQLENSVGATGCPVCSHTWCD